MTFFFIIRDFDDETREEGPELARVEPNQVAAALHRLRPGREASATRLQQLLDRGAGAGAEAEARIGSLTGQLDDEKQISQRALSQVELLNQQIAALRKQIGALEYRDEGYFLLCGQTLSLTPREQALLTVLMFRRTRPVSRQQLFEQVFSLNDDVSPESIELYIHRLRKKLQESNVRIVTLRGLGYRLGRPAVPA